MKGCSKEIINAVFLIVAIFCAQAAFSYSKVLNIEDVNLEGGFTGRQAEVTESYFGGSYHLSFAERDGAVKIIAEEIVPDLHIGIHTVDEGRATVWLRNSSNRPIAIKTIINNSKNKKGIRILSSDKDSYLGVGNTYEFDIKFKPQAKGRLSIDVVYGVLNGPMAVARVKLVPEVDNSIYYIAGVTTLAVAIPILYQFANWYYGEESKVDGGTTPMLEVKSYSVSDEKVKADGNTSVPAGQEHWVKPCPADDDDNGWFHVPRSGGSYEYVGPNRVMAMFLWLLPRWFGGSSASADDSSKSG